MAADVEREMAWSDVHAGLRVRWATPTFVRRGTIMERKGRSLRVRFDGLLKDTVIPDARWYFCEWKQGNQQEHLVVIEGSTPKRVRDLSEMDAHDVYAEITTAEAANILGVDQKTLRRMLRTGKIPGSHDGTRWRLIRKQILEARR